MPTYAAQTEVPADRSRAEIDRTVKRYGANQFMYGWDQDGRDIALVQFQMRGKRIRFTLPMPDRNSAEVRLTPARRERTARQQEDAYEQAVRQRWRALALLVKAKLEAVESGITEFEEEFLPHIVLPNDRTVAQWVRPTVEEVYQTGCLPAMLPGLLPAHVEDRA